ncbi:hypothetical protein K432DRAFT_219766 [Lepidopterella palustris CBS 459.81]|uniref:Uncharacterized protein n=1 Tax=Lepidopterella palustris CBS 459.81 TaxID=1314670 RepID=A0A8E2EEY6_9PEZI|nr:hypothetical protein K432DRAFT_219766 [Lepidopterella palustris CBS 459.81]
MASPTGISFWSVFVGLEVESAICIDLTFNPIRSYCWFSLRALSQFLEFFLSSPSLARTLDTFPPNHFLRTAFNPLLQVCSHVLLVVRPWFIAGGCSCVRFKPSNAMGEWQYKPMYIYQLCLACIPSGDEFLDAGIQSRGSSRGPTFPSNSPGL